MTITRRRLLRVAAASVAAAACAPAALRRPRPVRLVFYTDVHARPSEEIAGALDRTSAAIRAQHPDVILCGGDSIEGGSAVSEQAARPMWRVYGTMMLDLIGRQVFHAVGNHDLVAGADARASARDVLALERTYYSFDASHVHFVVLDSVELLEGDAYRGYIGLAQLDWLRRDLAEVAPATPVVAVTHMPLLTGFFGPAEPGQGPPDRVVQNAAAVLDVLETRNTVAVLQGHLHVFEALRLRSITFVTGGAVCGRWWKGVHHGTPPGFAVVTLDGSRVETRYVGCA